jgi:SOS response regulatory protein OraA/RecX
MASSGPHGDDEAYLLAIKWLAKRSLTGHEIYERLARRGIDRPPDLLDRLRAGGWQSDERVVEQELAEARRQAWGPGRLAGRLRRRGITAEMATAAMARLTDEDVQRLAQHEARRLALRGYDGARVARFLERRGFPAAVIWRVVDSMAKPDADRGP